MLIDSGRVKSVLSKFEVDLVGMIYNGLVFDVPKLKTYGLIKKELVWTAKSLNLTQSEVNYLWKEATSKYVKCSKFAYLGLSKARKTLGTVNYASYMEKRKEEAFLSVEKCIISEMSWLKNVNEVYKSCELRFKKEKLDSMDSIFYICSWHSDCAKDHLAYQGRIYVDKNWKSKALISDVDRIEAYIRNHDVLTLQEVTSGEPWLCTRPYCRHYFAAVDVDSVLKGSAKKILQEKNMIDRKDYQMSNAERYKRVYSERLRMHSSLYKLIPCSLLSERMKEDRKLIKKWASLV